MLCLALETLERFSQLAAKHSCRFYRASPLDNSQHITKTYNYKLCIHLYKHRNKMLDKSRCDCTSSRESRMKTSSSPNGSFCCAIIFTLWQLSWMLNGVLYALWFEFCLFSVFTWSGERDSLWEISPEAYTPSELKTLARRRKKSLMRVSKQLQHNFMHACLIAYHYRHKSNMRTRESERRNNVVDWIIVIKEKKLLRALKFNWINFAFLLNALKWKLISKH